MNVRAPYKIGDEVVLPEFGACRGKIVAIDWDLENMDVEVPDLNSPDGIRTLVLNFERVGGVDDRSYMETAGLDVSLDHVKDTNPKDALGCKKPSTHFIPRPVLYEVGNALFEGACKYGAYNWREAGVRATVYQNACARHLDAWLEGEDIDPDSGIHHVSKAIAGLMVIRDAMICGKFVDDRPPRAPKDWLREIQAQTDAILAKYPNPVPPYTENPL